MPKPLWTLTAAEMIRQIDGRKSRAKLSQKKSLKRRQELEKQFPNLKEQRRKED
jgi:hypothetical protein